MCSVTSVHFVTMIDHVRITIYFVSLALVNKSQYYTIHRICQLLLDSIVLSVRIVDTTLENNILRDEGGEGTGYLETVACY